MARVVDTTGAGDLFAAGFLFGLSSGRDLRTCGCLGSIAAAGCLGLVAILLLVAIVIVWQRSQRRRAAPV